MRIIRIGTRGSRLALRQTEMVQEALSLIAPEIKTEVCVMKTTGDILSEASLDAIGGKGVFVKEIERALISEEIDCAVHSLKDMQAVLPEGLAVSAYLKREDPRDMLFSQEGYTLKTLPKGSRVGTSSMRRRCQLKILRPDLEIVAIRGNVPTRLGKVGNGFDAVILAAAGVKRLGLAEGVTLDIEEMLPSPGQGVIAIESRASDARLNAMLRELDHIPTRVCAEAERSFLAALGQDCNLPAGAHATFSDSLISITGILGYPDESSVEKMHLEGGDASVGTRLGLELKNRVHPGEGLS